MNTASHVKEFIRNKYAWPGGYPMYAITSDGGVLCHSCCQSEFRNIVGAIHANNSDGWLVEAITVNWEDPDLFCDHCSEPVESAYCE